MCKKFLMALLMFGCLSAFAQSKPDSRTPFQKYQGAYTGAWLLCLMESKLAYVREVARKRNIEPERDRDGDIFAIETCIKNGLASMKVEYKNMLAVIVVTKTNGAEKALLDHYVAAIQTVKGISYRGESEEDLMRRLNENRAKVDELWTRFEITQP